jgi:hypothetical protein
MGLTHVLRRPSCQGRRGGHCCVLPLLLAEPARRLPRRSGSRWAGWQGQTTDETELPPVPHQRRWWARRRISKLKARTASSSPPPTPSSSTSLTTSPLRRCVPHRVPRPPLLCPACPTRRRSPPRAILSIPPLHQEPLVACRPQLRHQASLPLMSSSSAKEQNCEGGPSGRWRQRGGGTGAEGSKPREGRRGKKAMYPMLKAL